MVTFVGSLETLSLASLGDYSSLDTSLDCHFLLLSPLGIQQLFSFSLLKPDDPSWWLYWEVPDIPFYGWPTSGSLEITHVSFAPQKVKTHYLFSSAYLAAADSQFLFHPLYFSDQPILSLSPLCYILQATYI